MTQPPVIGVIGVGYVGLVTAACFAELGNHVVCRDIVPEKVARLREGHVPIYEPGLADLVKRNAQRLQFTTEIRDVTERASIIFVCVNTPPMYSGDADLSFVEAVIAELPDDVGDVVLAMKSTVPVGTGERMQALLEQRGLTGVRYVSNPEFLKEGDAIRDFMNPDRVVIGGDDEAALDRMATLHRPLECTIVRTDVATAEMVKYASNAFLATKISFINEIANVCEETGADVAVVAEGMGLDKRIGPHFLRAGLGFGGSCLSGDETVLVRRDGIVQLLELRTCFDQAAGMGSTATLVEPDGLEVLAWQPGAAEPEFHPVATLTRRWWTGEAVTVRTKMGRRVVATPDHPFVVTDGALSGTQVKLAEELTDADWLPIAQGRRDGDDLGVGIVLSGMRHEGLGAGDVLVTMPEGARARLGFNDIEDSLPVEPRAATARAYEIKASGTTRLDEAVELALPIDDCHVKTARNGTLVPVRITYDERFWRMVGLYLAEGHIGRDGRRRRIQWSFHPHDEQHLVEEVASYWRSLGVRSDVRQAQTTRTVTVSSRLLAGWFEGELGVGIGAYDHRIPDAIWQAPATHRMALLSGLWEGDGSWSRVNRGSSVVLEYGTVSRALADGIMRLLGDMGIVARMKVGRTAKSTVDTYWLCVSGAAQVRRLVELVRHDRRDEVLACIDQVRPIAPTGYRRDGDGAAWVRVVDVEATPHDGFVYSMEVPGPETMVTTGGLVVHNCFPKDVTALKQLAGNSGYHFQLLNAVIEVNELQKRRLVGKLQKHLGPLRGRTITLLGLAFKPGTDDMREAASLVIAARLLAEGATVRGHDPVANEAARPLLHGVELFDDPMEALEGADAMVLVTEWPEYAELDLVRVRETLRTALLVDGRNLYSPQQAAAAGLTYEAIGRPGVVAGTPRRRAEDASIG